MISIHFDKTVFYIANTMAPELSAQKGKPGFEIIENPDAETVKNFAEKVKCKSVTGGAIIHADINAALEMFKQHFETIQAAGGIVLNDQKELLFIFRRGKWDLPKGKADEGETPEATAEREIKEETNIGPLKLKYKVGETYHIYLQDGKTILKTSIWFHFTTTGRGKPRGQEDEDITEVKWVPTVDIKQPMQNTYETIREILHRFFDKP